MKCILFFSLFIFVSCADTATQDELAKVKSELETAKTKISELESNIEPEGDLVHVVFFKVKPDADEAALVTEIKKLEGIKEVMDLEVGPFEDLEDARALSEYSVMMEISFADEAAYQTYQKHPIHLTLKENVKAFLAGPPATYDFVKK